MRERSEMRERREMREMSEMSERSEMRERRERRERREMSEMRERSEMSAHNIRIKIEPDIRWNRQLGFRFNPNICGPAIYNIKKDLKTGERPRL